MSLLAAVLTDIKRTVQNAITNQRIKCRVGLHDWKHDNLGGIARKVCDCGKIHNIVRYY